MDKDHPWGIIGGSEGQGNRIRIIGGSERDRNGGGNQGEWGSEWEWKSERDRNGNRNGIGRGIGMELGRGSNLEVQSSDMTRKFSRPVTFFLTRGKGKMDTSGLRAGLEYDLECLAKVRRDILILESGGEVENLTLANARASECSLVQAIGNKRRLLERVEEADRG